MNIRCFIFGCDTREEESHYRCHRCGEEYYGQQQPGLWRRLLWEVRRFTYRFRWPRCAECGKRLNWRKRAEVKREGVAFCSAKCQDCWIPF